MRARHIILLLVAAAVATAMIHSYVSNRAVTEIRQAVRKGQMGPESAVDLSLRGVELTQGEQGEEVWKLKARGAWYEQAGGVIQVSQPEIIYYLRSDRSELLVRSSRGVVSQQDRLARLWENVEIERNGGSIRSDLLIYNGTDHTLNMPGEARFDGPDLYGTASGVTVYLNDNVLRAEGGVDVEMRIRQGLKDIMEGNP